MKFYLTKAAQKAAESGQAGGAASAALSAPRASRRAPATSSPAVSQAASSADQKPEPAKAIKQRANVMTIGGEARVDLLPTEVRADRRSALQVRRVWLGVAGIAVLAVIATSTATIYAKSANMTLAATQNQTTSLVSQQGQYSAVSTIQGEVALIDAARHVAGSTDIDWPSYLQGVQATIPAGMTLSQIGIDSASPILAYPQATTPLQGQRVATLTLAATSSSLPSVTTWLSNMTSLLGYVDAEPGIVSLDSGVYTANVTLHVNQKAFSGTFTKKDK